MDRLEVSPQSVRGYGNIILPKLSTDFVGKYNEIYTDEDGYFVLSYGGVMLKASATVSNTIKGIQASLTVLVSTRDGDTPVSGLSVDCSVDSVALTGKTTDSTGKCTFTWTPSDLGDSSLLISVSPQDDYAGLSLDKTVTVGLLLGFYEIMTSLSLEDDEVYSGTFEVQVEDRSQLSEFVKDVWVASGGEPIVDEYGIIHICEPGDLVVESEGLEQLPEYSNVLFEEDVDLLTGAVYDMSISEDYEIVLDCLERDDIVPSGPTVSVILTSSESSISIGESVIFTATCMLSGEPIVGETVSFYDGDTLLGSDETDSDGVATYTASSLSVGSHTVSAVCEDKNSNNVSVTVNKLTPSISLSVPATGTVGTAYTVSGTLVPTSGSVKLYENNVLKDTLTVTSGSFSKSITQNAEGTYSYYVVFEGSSTYDSITSSTSSIVVSDTPAPTPASVSLTSDKSILSYADSESAILSATVLDSGSNPLEGVTVEFFNGSTSLGTADTNSSGVATKSYASAGSGDVSFTAEVDSIISSEIYVEDCTYYSTTEYSSTSSLNITLPSTFKLTFAFNPTDRSTSSGGNSAYVRMGTSSTTGIWVGQGASNGNHGIMVRPSTNYWCNTVSNTGTWNSVECTFDGSTLLYKCNGESVSTSTSSSILSKINGVAPTSKAHLKEIKVKPL